MNSKPPTNKEVATLVEYARMRIRELGSPPTLVELEEFCECVRVKLPVLTHDQSIEIVRLALHNVPMQKSSATCETIPTPMGRPPKLTSQQQADALQRLGSGESQTAIAKSYGVDPATISRLRSDKWYLRG
jgi:hypothetical protein